MKRPESRRPRLLILRMLVCAGGMLAMTGPGAFATAQTAEALSPDSPALTRSAEPPTWQGDATGVRMWLLYDTATADTVDVPRRIMVRHDPWLSFDKVQHFTFSFLFTLGGQYTFENKFDLRQGQALPLAVTGSFLIGLSKELYDYHLGPRRYFSYRDMVANGAGIVVAVGFILL
jgi:uncharacterized protein YfiM (DUF2279 family)